MSNSPSIHWNLGCAAMVLKVSPSSCNESLLWRHNGHNHVSNHLRLDCLLTTLFQHRSKKTSKLRVTGLCQGNSPVTGEFPAHRASNAENVSIWWCHHDVVHKHFLQNYSQAPTGGIFPGECHRIPLMTEWTIREKPMLTQIHVTIGHY